MSRTPPFNVDPHFGPNDPIYIYDAVDKTRSVVKLNRSGETFSEERDADVYVAYEIVKLLNELYSEDITDGGT